MFYLIDGRVIHSLKTRVKRLAEARLEQYVRRQFRLGPATTIKEFYARWIETKKEPLVRRSCIRDYRQHFSAYILPELGHLPLTAVGIGELQRLRAKLLADGLGPKTAKNIIASSLRALWKDAIGEEIVEREPFRSLKWPRAEPRPPDPFSAEERDIILAHMREQKPFYYPFVYTLFWTGMRPSEAVALRLCDVDLKRRTFSITKSRHLGVDSQPKTSRSRRIITVSNHIADLIQSIRLPWEQSQSHVFYNKHSGGPLDPNQWARVYWARILQDAGVRHRKFYSTRHTFITEMVKRGENFKAVADYCGTSPTMIERDYCGRLSLSHLTEIEPELPKSLERVVVPTGLEPAGNSKHNIPESINARLLEYLRRRKAG